MTIPSELVIEPLVLHSPFAKSLSNAISDFSSPDVELMIPGLEKTLHFHRATLSQASATFANVFRGEDNPACKFDEETHHAEWLDDTSAHDEKYRGLLVKWLRFCYGEDQTFTLDECPVALTVLSQLQLQGQDEFKSTIEDYTKKVEEKIANHTTEIQHLLAKHPEIMAGEKVKAMEEKYSYRERCLLCELLKRNEIPTQKLVFSRKDSTQYYGDDDENNPHRHDYSLMLSTILKTNTTLTSLYIISYDWKTSGTKEICETLKTNTTLTKLRFDYLREKEEQEAVRDLVNASTTLKILNLRDCRIKQEGLKIVLPALKSNSTITELNIRADSIRGGEDMIKELMTTNTTLVKLNLKHNPLAGIGEALKNNSTLTWLNLSNVDQDGNGLCISEGLQSNNSLTWLNLSHCVIGPAEGAKIGEALKTNHGLTQLRFKRSQLMPGGACKIGEALKTNTTLNCLRIRQCNIGPDGGIGIGEGLKKNSGLTFLDLSFNNLMDAGTIPIAMALRTNTTLQKLDLRETSIHHEGTKALCESLKTNTTLIALSLSNNAIGRKRTAMISDMLKVNKSLKTLVLMNNHIHDAEARVLSDALRINTTLTSVELRLNLTTAVGVGILNDVLKTNTNLKELNTNVCEKSDDCVVM